jgi:hypothetical protein
MWMVQESLISKSLDDSLYDGVAGRVFVVLDFDPPYVQNPRFLHVMLSMASS